tara:strand:- start:139 stop:435 length:297 start_codon:yes stop_codon:yes gene_type:complete
MNWFEDQEPTEHDKKMLRRLQQLERKHHHEKPVHCKRWYSSSSNQLVKKTLVPVESSGIISGGKCFVNKLNRSLRHGSLNMTAAPSYTSPLLLKHERP